MADLNANQYVDKDGVKARYGDQMLIQITNFNDEDTFTTINDTNLDRAIDDASDLMDGYLLSQFPTPINPAPDFFAPDCAAITVGLLIERKGFIEDTPDAACVKAKKEILKKFMDISQGKIALELPDSSGDTASELNILSTAPAKLFTADDLSRY